MNSPSSFVEESWDVGDPTPKTSHGTDPSPSFSLSPRACVGLSLSLLPRTPTPALITGQRLAGRTGEDSAGLALRIAQEQQQQCDGCDTQWLIRRSPKLEQLSSLWAGVAEGSSSIQAADPEEVQIPESEAEQSVPSAQPGANPILLDQTKKKV